MTTSNAAAADKTNEKTAEKSGPAKLSEKLAEKRRALGRGLESLLPGPRVVPVPASPTLPQSARKDGAPVRTGRLRLCSGQAHGTRVTGRTPGDFIDSVGAVGVPSASLRAGSSTARLLRFAEQPLRSG